MAKPDSGLVALKTQFLFILFSRGIGSALQAVLIIIFARLAGADGMGIVAIVTGAMSMLLAIAEFGMSPLLAKSRAIGDESMVRGIVFANSLTTAVFGVLGFLGLWWYLSANSLPVFVAGLALAVAIEKNTDVLLNIPIADGDKWTPAISILLRRITTLLIFSVLVITRPEWALLGYVAALLCGSVVGQVHFRIFVSKRDCIEGRADLKTLVGASLPYSVSNIAAQSRSLDTVIVGMFSSVGTAGLYSAAIKLTNPLNLVASSLASVVMPHAARNDTEYSFVLGRRLMVMTGGVLALVIPVAFYSEAIVTLLLGDDYSAAAGALAWGLIALPFISLSSPLGSLLQSQGEQRFVAWNGFIFALLMLPAIALAAVYLGSTGAALALALTYGSKCLSLWLRIVRIRTSA